MDLILVGNLPENIQQLVEQYFGGYSRGPSSKTEYPSLNPLEKKLRFHISDSSNQNLESPEESSAKIFVEFVVPHLGHEDSSLITVLKNLLGGGYGSRISKNLGQEKGLAYDVSVGYNGEYNAGIFQVVATVPAPKIQKSIDAIFEELKELKTQPVHRQELDKFRKRVKFAIASGYESNDGHIMAIESKLDYNETPESVLKEFDAVTPQALLDAAQKYIPSRDGNYFLFIQDPLKDRNPNL